MTYNSYKVIGPQRTGTNWINELISKNFEVKAGGKFWKHLTTLGVKNTEVYKHAMYKPENLVLPDNVFFIATSKDLDLWRKSLQRRPVDFFRTHNTQTTDPVLEVYQVWHQWKDQQLNKHNFYYRDYMDWLENWREYLLEIQNITGWTRKNPLGFIEINGPVSMSPNFDIKNYKE